MYKGTNPRVVNFDKYVKINQQIIQSINEKNTIYYPRIYNNISYINIRSYSLALDIEKDWKQSQGIFIYIYIMHASVVTFIFCLFFWFSVSILKTIL